MHTGTGLRLDMIDPADQPLVEIGVIADRVVDAVLAFEQPGQYVVDIVDRKGVVGAIMFDRTFLPGTAAVPGFLLRIFFAAEQDEFTVFAAWYQHQHRVGLLEAGQVEKIAVLAKRKMHVLVAHDFGRRGQDGNRVTPHHFHQLAAAAFEFGWFHQESCKLEETL